MNDPRRCLITGGRGYLGSELARNLRGAGWQVITASRSATGPDEVAFTLNEDLPVELLRACGALIHCAYDFGPSRWKEIHQTNVEGTRRLLDQAVSAGVKTIITISSISAFAGCKSLYGKAKLLIEQETLARSGIVLRPGLIYGGSDRGMYGKLSAQARTKIIPIMAGNPCTQYLVHVDDVAEVVRGWLDTRWPKTATPWTIAHPEPWPLRKLVSVLSPAAGNRPIFVPIPWPVIWLGLKAFESVGLPLAFKSDSVISIVNQNLRPDFEPLLASGIALRRHEPEVVDRGHS